MMIQNDNDFITKKKSWMAGWLIILFLSNVWEAPTNIIMTLREQITLSEQISKNEDHERHWNVAFLNILNWMAIYVKFKVICLQHRNLANVKLHYHCIHINHKPV